jgi:hypothetical protein
MNKERLLKLAEHLETKVPPKQFNMDIWGRHNGVFCGCAIGWAAQSTYFKRLGFSLKYYGDGTAEETPTYSSCGEIVESVMAGRSLFDLNQDDFENLFKRPMGDKRTPKQVAKDIRNFVKSKE